MKKRGFTLIELLVVISIIGILVAVGIVSYTRTVKLSRDAKRKTDIEQIRQALETDRSENLSYPTGQQYAGGATPVLSPTYITTVPTDPQGHSYTYTQTSSTTYNLCSNYMEIGASSYCASNP